ncbi:MAG: DMT family transporter [Burkholderiaceae bacterium]
MTDVERRYSQRIGLLCLLVTSVGWGVNWPATKVLLEQLPPLFVRGSAGMMAAAGLAMVAALRGDSLRVPRHLFGRLFASSMTNVFAWMGFATLSMKWLSAGQAAMLVYTMPIWATLLAWPLAGRRPTARASTGLLLSMIGLWVLLGARQTPLGEGMLIGAGFALASALLFAFGTVALRPMPELAPIPNLAWQVGLGCLPMVLIGLIWEHPHLAAVRPIGWWLLAYMTVVPMGVCYLCWFAALRRLPPATASVGTLLTPVIGVFAAAATLGEPLGARELLALVLTLGGVALALRRGAGDSA